MSESGRGRGGRPAGEGLAARIPGLVVALAGAGLLGWSLWSGSRPVQGLDRGGAEWLVPERPTAERGARPEPATGRESREGAGPETRPAGVVSEDAGEGGATRPQDAPAGAGAVLLIDVNVATAAQFELLPEIGPTLARRIVEDRGANGPFVEPDDLMRVPGIGPKTLEKIRGLIVCGGA